MCRQVELCFCEENELSSGMRPIHCVSQFNQLDHQRIGQPPEEPEELFLFFLDGVMSGQMNK